MKSAKDDDARDRELRVEVDVLGRRGDDEAKEDCCLARFVAPVE